MRALVIALGGNALIRPGEEGTVAEQYARLRELGGALRALPADQPLVLTHGNGPQVGRVLLRSDMCAGSVPTLPVDLAVASTQGTIGAMLAQLIGETTGRPAAALITHTLVDPRDPAFADPRKFVGRFYSEEEAQLRAAEMGWQVREDPGRGWRRVLPSPTPEAVLELEAIRALLAAQIAVVAGGGGGVPVIQMGQRLAGVEAVVDKDHASALLAAQLDARRLFILTGVDEVMVDFGRPTQRPLREVSVAALREHAMAGQFPAGSMGPKIEAALNFLAGGGEEVLITSPERLADALAGERGTWIQQRSQIR